MGPICISTQDPLNVRQQCKTPSCHAAISFNREMGTCYSRYDCSSMEIQPSAKFLPYSQLCCPRCIRRSKTKGKTYVSPCQVIKLKTAPMSINTMRALQKNTVAAQQIEKSAPNINNKKVRPFIAQPSLFRYFF